MLEFVSGNLLEADVDAYVNTVNTEGVMGKGIALQVKRRFPIVYKVYAQAAKHGDIKIGQVQVVPTQEFSPRFVINFPTKTTWRKPSDIDYIIKGMPSLRKAITDFRIESIAIPPLGAGNGGLDWSVVKPIIQAALKDLPNVRILIYEPTGAIYSEGSEAVRTVTDKEAALLATCFRYFNIEGTISQIEVQKLGYFLQRVDPQFQFQFMPHRYGPYSEQIRHIIVGWEGRFLHGLKAGDAGAFDDLTINYAACEQVITEHSSAQNPFLASLSKALGVISGWESGHSLELLATVDWCLQNNSTIPVGELPQTIAQWGAPSNPEWGQRKAERMRPEDLAMAYSHLKAHGHLLTNPVLLA